MRYLVILLLSLSTAVSAQIIDTVNIIGNAHIDKGTVLTYTPFEEGDFYDKRTEVLIRNKLMATGFFRDVIVTDAKNTLTIELIENPVIRSLILNMDGNTLLSEEVIKDNLKRLGITEGSLYNQRNMEDLIAEIKKTYVNGGYVNATASYDTTVSSDNLATIVINLKENTITKVKTVTISGNTAFTDEELLDVLTIGEADNPIINFFTERDHFSKVELDASIQKLSDFYINHGYLDATIENVDVKPDTDGKMVIAITLHEGEQYILSGLTFSGVAEDLHQQFRLPIGAVFHKQEVIRLVQDVTNHFLDQGYAFVKVNANPQKQGNTVDLNIDIDTKQKVYINRITITGNTRTEDEVVRREIGVFEGGLYNNSAIEKSIKRMKRLGFFKDVSMKVSQEVGASDRINLHFEVVEDKTGRFSIGISHSNATGVAFNTGIRESNIFGTGNTLNAEISYSSAVKNFDFYFLDPYFNNKGHSMSYGVFAKTVDGSELESADYIVDKLGVSFGYGIPLGEDTRMKFDTRLSKTDITCSTIFGSDDYEKTQCDKDLSSELLTSVTFTENTLNHFYFPTEGEKKSLRLSVALPALDYSYYKIDADYDKYIPLKNDMTVKFGTSIGLGNGLGGEELPFFERYYGGGASSVRGFTFNSLGPKYPDDTSKGGAFDVVGSVALISPLPQVKNSENMRISGFIDVGNVYATTSDFAAGDLRAAMGVAFIWVTPIGPLGIYAATPLKKQDGDDTTSFDFILGSTF